MAKRLDVSSAFLSAVENGKKKVPDAWLPKLETFYSLNSQQMEELRNAIAESADTVELNIQNAYSDMDLWRQLESVAKNRWVGAYWQSKGRLVIPTVSWSDARSYEFCFDGVEYGSAVAVGMIGCKRSKLHFLRGYCAMIEKINPSQILCFGTPFPEMQGDLVVVDYRDSRKVVR